MRVGRSATIDLQARGRDRRNAVPSCAAARSATLAPRGRAGRDCSPGRVDMHPEIVEETPRVVDREGGLIVGVSHEVAVPSLADCASKSTLRILHRTAGKRAKRYARHAALRHRPHEGPPNPLGVTGAGEGGIIPVASAVASAVEDALDPFGIVIRELPIEPARLAATIRGDA